MNGLQKSMRHVLILTTIFTTTISDLYAEGFSYGTVVRTPDGYKCIEDLQPGDTILSVKGPRHRTSTGTIRAVYCLQDWPMGVLSLSCGECRCAPEQRFCSIDGSWIRADRLRTGDKLMTLDNVCTEVLDTWQPQELSSVYSVNVEPGHTLIVESGHPLIAHNAFFEVPILSYVFGAGWQLPGLATLSSLAAGVVYIGAEKAAKWANKLWGGGEKAPHIEYDSTICNQPLSIDRFEAQSLDEAHSDKTR